MEFHEFIRVWKGDLEVGGDNFKRGKFEGWCGQLVGNIDCDFDVRLPVLPNDVFWCLFCWR